MKDKKLIIVSGFALFSMFFGAGNLIFPPYLGNKVGDQYLIAMIGFLLSSVGLVFLGLLAATKCGGTIEKIGNTISPRFSLMFSTIIMLAIGPGLAIPRTAATTVEVIQKGFVKEANSILLTAIFFVCVYLFVRKPNTIINNLGKILTPLLIVTLLAIILKGIISPVATPVNTYQIQVFQSSFEEGYQTMDALASIVFAIVVTKGFMQNGIKDEDKIKDYTIKSATIAAIGLCFVYGGLLFIGATTSNLNLGNMERIELLLYICNQQLGVFGKILICIAMTLACLTTAIGLTTTVGEFFGDMLKDKTNGIMSYDLIIIISTVFSAFFAVVGVEKILKISAPILSAIYPVAIVLIFLNLFNKDTFEKNTKLGAIIGASIFGFLILLNSFKLDFGLLKLIESVFPMQIKSFIWIIPAVIGGLIGKIKK
ncbi:branched-chain amino acid transport system II carrier protein [Finegoldia magna]|uniref:branched-chain amino acid transport system II carrier protein n=1 Tax=Finegoldia magna TaxID=1260 RepID=UPI002912363E|nr:branched-chain amino acid transport system II carrier protein [Finegoldia magna]MDU7164769.1 branched-chain amino acid transport system II carrier protein [Finegoldia magna]